LYIDPRSFQEVHSVRIDDVAPLECHAKLECCILAINDDSIKFSPTLQPMPTTTATVAANTDALRTACLPLIFYTFCVASRYCFVSNTLGNDLSGISFPRTRTTTPILASNWFSFTDSSIVLLVPLPSFWFEAAARRVKILVFHEAVETM
jgi:hypothetical protein